MAWSVGVGGFVVVIQETDAADTVTVDVTGSGGAEDTFVVSECLAGQAGFIAGNAVVVVVVSLSALGVARRPANVLVELVLAVARKTAFLGGVKAGLAVRVARSTHVVRVVEESIGFIARLNAFSGSQNVSGVTSHAFVISSTSAGRAALVAGQTLTVVEVEAWVTGGTVLGIGASAGVAFGLAGRADGVGVDVGVERDQDVTVLTFTLGVASSGSVALAVAVAFGDDALVEVVIVVDALGGQASSELEEESAGTFNTVVVSWAVAFLAGVVARNAVTLVVIEHSLIGVARNLAFSVGLLLSAWNTGVTVSDLWGIASLAVSTAGQTSLRVLVEESVIGVARNMANSVNQDLVLVTFDTVVIGWAVACEAAFVARFAVAILSQVPAVFTVSAFVVVGTSAVQTGLVARRTQIGVVFSRELLVQVSTVFTFA